MQSNDPLTVMVELAKAAPNYATIALVVYFFLKYRPKVAKNGTSGEMPVSYWTDRFNKLDMVLERQTELTGKVIDNQGQMVQILKVIEDRTTRSRAAGAD